MNRAVDGAHGVVIAIERLLPPFGRPAPGTRVANDARAGNVRERVGFFLGRDPAEGYGGCRLQATGYRFGAGPGWCEFTEPLCAGFVRIEDLGGADVIGAYDCGEARDG